MTALLGAWRRRHPRAFRIGFWYSLGAVSLPLLWLAALGLAPEAGLTRSYWYPVDASTEPIIEERITAIDLAFVDERHRPTRNYRVRWEGVWFSPRAERVDFYAGADDGVILRVDGETVLERSPAVGMHTVGRTVELGAGAHRLEIEHWQDGGGRSLNVQWAPAGGTPALLGPTRLFPEDPGALGYWLQFAAVRLPVLILLVWATGGAGALAAAVFVRQRRRAPTTERQRPPSPSLTRYDAAALTALCLALLVYGYGNLSLQQRSADDLENLTLGVRLAQDGVFQRWPGQFGDHRREPLGPSLIAVTDLGSEALGRGSVPSECVSNESTFRRDSCRRAYAPYRVVNLALLLAGALGVFWLVLRLTGVRVLAYLGFLMTAQSAALLGGADAFLTEVHAATLIVAVAALSWTTATARRPLYAALLGLALAGLVLTKVIFVYLWIPIALMLVAADWLRRRVDWTTAGLVGVLFTAQAIPVGGWMVRNYLTSGDFSIVEARSASVLGYRSTFNTMRHDEWTAGFAYYLPLTRASLQSAGILEESFKRFDSNGENGFRQTERRRNARRRAELNADDNPVIAGLDELDQRRWVNDTMSEESIARLLADPGQHLKVSLLLAWRGVFVEEGLGFVSDPPNPRLADVADRHDWPRWRRAYGPTGAAFVNLIGFLALIVVPLWFWLGRGRFDVILVFLPALYSHGVYALASHFPGRYAEPQIPLRVTATMLLLYLAWTSLRAVRSRSDQN